MTLIQRKINVEFRRRIWRRWNDVENKFFDVAIKYQRRLNVETTSCAGGELFDSVKEQFILNQKRINDNKNKIEKCQKS